MTDVKPRVSITERSTDLGDEQNGYILGRTVTIDLTRRGKQEFIDYVYNKQLGV